MEKSATYSHKEVSADTQLVLVNAVYFKADWDKQFKKASTTSQPFALANGQIKRTVDDDERQVPVR